MNEMDELQATTQQQRMFFALCRELRLDSEVTKEKIKKKLNIDSFAHISKKEMSQVIDAMLRKMETRVVIALTAFFKMHIMLQNDEKKSTDDFSEYLAKELIRHFNVRNK